MSRFSREGRPPPVNASSRRARRKGRSSPLEVPVGAEAEHRPRTAALPCSAALLVTSTTGPPEPFVSSRRRRVGCRLGPLPGAPRPSGLSQGARGTHVTRRVSVQLTFLPQRGEGENWGLQPAAPTTTAAARSVIQDDSCSLPGLLPTNFFSFLIGHSLILFSSGTTVCPAPFTQQPAPFPLTGNARVTSNPVRST